MEKVSKKRGTSQNLHHNTDLDCLLGGKYNRAQLNNELKYVDLYYGSVTNECFEDDKIESDILCALIKISELETEDDVPTKEAWLKLFKNLSAELIIAARNKLASFLDWDEDEADGVIEDYLKAIRPVIKDLKENEEAIFVRFYGGRINVEPASSEVLLEKRVAEHFEKLKSDMNFRQKVFKILSAKK